MNSRRRVSGFELQKVRSVTTNPAEQYPCCNDPEVRSWQGLGKFMNCPQVQMKSYGLPYLSVLQ